MNRRRSRRSYRRNNAYTWQSVAFQADLTGPSAGDNKSYILGYVTPGIGDGAALPTSIRPFDAPHVLERMRGHICHDGATPAQGTEGNWFPFTIAAMKIPNGVIIDDSDIPSVVNNTDGDDYFYYGSHICGARVSSNVDPVDSKAKRRFDVGDKIAWIANIINPFTGNINANVDVTVNLRLLWKLGK